MLTPNEMRALENLIQAKIENALVRNSSGPHVSEVRRAHDLARVEAWQVLTGGTVR